MSRWATGALLLLAVGVPAVRATPLCTLVVEADTGKTLRQEGRCEERQTPASTFKIPLSLIGYDSGYLIDAHHPALPFREGYTVSESGSKATVDPTTWISNSVVWYSQQLTAWLGAERLQHYITRFGYGNQNLTGNAGMNDGLTQAWLSSSLRISPEEQVAFLRRLVNRELPVTTRAYEMTARLTAVSVLPGGWEVHGKTGAGYLMRADGSADIRQQVGWFVGWASRGPRTVVFACDISDDRPDSTRIGRQVREDFLARLPALLDGAPAR